MSYRSARRRAFVFSAARTCAAGALATVGVAPLHAQVTPPPPPPVSAPTVQTAPAPVRQQPDIAAPKVNRSGQIDARFQQMHDKFLQEGKTEKIDLLFLGDSITEGWGKAKSVWQDHYGKYSPENFGIGGDQTQHVLWRIDNGELDGIHPKVVVLLIGTNNIGYPADAIVRGDTKIVAEIHQKLPDAKVLLLGIFPRGADPADRRVAATRAKIKGINAELAKLDDGNKTRYLDLGDKFLDANGVITRDIMADALHPTAAGYVIWADSMQPLLDEMMK